jgi:hypothetical protein
MPSPVSQRIAATLPHRQRGIALVLVMFVLTVFSLLALAMVFFNNKDLALTDNYTVALDVHNGVNSAVEHAKAVLAADTLTVPKTPLATASSGPSGSWVRLARDDGYEVLYRWKLVDNGAVSTASLPWNAAAARQAAHVTRSATGWQRIVDPLVASHERLTRICRHALNTQTLPEQYADELALTISDAFDANSAVAFLTSDDYTGYEGVFLESVWRGDNRVIPASHIVRQSYFYDIDIVSDPLNTFKAFTIAESEPWYDPVTGTTNTRVRLSNSVHTPERNAEWHAFTVLWQLVYPHRFIPHAWQGVTAYSVLECGGHKDRLLVLDNDTNSLYFAGYPLPECGRNRYIILDLCDDYSTPGCVSTKRPLSDIWFVTGLVHEATYRVRIQHDSDATTPGFIPLNGRFTPEPDAGTDSWYTITAARGQASEGFHAFRIDMQPGNRIISLCMMQSDVFAFRNTGCHDLYVSGWHWVRHTPEHIRQSYAFNSCCSRNTDPRYPDHDTFTIKPGEPWYWATDLYSLPPEVQNHISWIPLEDAGIEFKIQKSAIVPSPLGGWAWKLSINLHPDFLWVPDMWRTALCFLASKNNRPSPTPYRVIENTASELLIHAGHEEYARLCKPPEGSHIWLGSLVRSTIRQPSKCENAYGHVCVPVPQLPRTPPRRHWFSPQRLLSHPVRQSATYGHQSCSPLISSRINMTPVIQSISPEPDVRRSLVSALDDHIAPIGQWLVPDTGTVARGWIYTDVTLAQTAPRQWKIAHSAVPVPDNFWKNSEIYIPVSGTRYRIVTSRAGHLAVDHSIPGTGIARACISPGFMSPMFRAISNRTESIFTWSVPASCTFPCRMCLYGFHVPSTNRPPRFSVSFWNWRSHQWIPSCITNEYNQQDIIPLGRVPSSCLSGTRTVRTKITAEGSQCWIKGMYAVSPLTVGNVSIATAPSAVLQESLGIDSTTARALSTTWHSDPRTIYADPGMQALLARCATRSDGYTVGFSVTILRNGRLVGTRSGSALLLRSWQDTGTGLEPRVRCASLILH